MKTASLAAGKGIGGEAVSSTKAVPLFYDILAPNNKTDSTGLSGEENFPHSGVPEEGGSRVVYLVAQLCHQRPRFFFPAPLCDVDFWLLPQDVRMATVIHTSSRIYSLQQRMIFLPS